MAGGSNQFGSSGGPPNGSPAKRIQAALRGDPRRATIFLVLLTVLLVMWARLFMGNHSPAQAVAEHLVAAVDGSASDNTTAPRTTRRQQTGLSLSDWARQPVNPLSRNLFSVPYDYYPRDPNHPQPNQNADNGAAKSAAAQADLLKERRILVENIREQAASLSLEGIVMGPNPKASVNGQLLGVGQDIGATGFRIVKIEPRRVFVESHGIRIDLAMK